LSAVSLRLFFQLFFFGFKSASRVLTCDRSQLGQTSENFRQPCPSSASWSASCLSSLICGAEQHKLTKNWLHSNFSANRTRVHLRGLVALGEARMWRFLPKRQWVGEGCVGGVAGRPWAGTSKVDGNEGGAATGASASRSSEINWKVAPTQSTDPCPIRLCLSTL
ncbi:hypothetical protein KCU65_g275, partial [Aureobasidium melanogenum]